MINKVSIFVPARLDSKRLPNKMILPLGDSNMFDIACKKLNNISREHSIDTYVLIYDKELIDIANKYKNLKIVLRTKESTQVDGPLTVTFGGVKDMEGTHMMFLNPCLTFLKEETIVRVVREFEISGIDYATSVKPLQNWLFDNEGYNINEIDYKELNTKTIKPIYQAAHAFHIFNKEQFLKDGKMLVEGHGVIEIDKEETIDIDTQDEYEFAYWKWSQ